MSTPPTSDDAKPAPRGSALLAAAFLGVVGVGLYALVRPAPPPAEPAPAPSASVPRAATIPQPRLSADIAGRREQRDLAHPIDNELCALAAKHWNVLHGNAETDPKGTRLLSFCLGNGNVAWYECSLQAETADAFDACTRTKMFRE